MLKEGRQWLSKVEVKEMNELQVESLKWKVKWKDKEKKEHDEIERWRHRVR